MRTSQAILFAFAFLQCGIPQPVYDLGIGAWAERPDQDRFEAGTGPVYTQFDRLPRNLDLLSASINKPLLKNQLEFPRQNAGTANQASVPTGRVEPCSYGAEAHQTA
jgi:hypothetical protein